MRELSTERPTGMPPLTRLTQPYLLVGYGQLARGLQKVDISFEQPGATHYGGMILFQQFCRRLDLKRLFQRYVPWEQRDNTYPRSELLLWLIYTMVAGLERISDTRLLAYNRSFQQLLGVSRFPAENPLCRFLKSLRPRELRGIVRVHDGLRSTLRPLPSARTSAPLDLDSTVLSL